PFCMYSAMVSLNRFWMSSMLPLFAICNSSRLFSRLAFSPGVRFLLAMCNTSCLLASILHLSAGLHKLWDSLFLCPIRPIAQNVAAFDFSKLLQKRDGLVTISAVASRYRQADRYSLPIDQGMNL